MVCTEQMRLASYESLVLLQKIGDDHQKEEATMELTRRELIKATLEETPVIAQKGSLKR